MKILLVTNMFPAPDRPAYGIFIKEQVDSLRRQGIGVEVLVIQGNKTKWNYLKGIFTVWQRVLSGDYAIIHAHYGLSGWVARMQFMRPVAVTFHGDDLLGTPVAKSGEQRAKSKYSLTSRILAGFNRMLARIVSGVIVQSVEMRRRCGWPGAKVIPCGVDFQVFKPIDRADACRQLGLDPAKRYVLFPSDPAIPVKNFGLAETGFKLTKAAMPNIELLALRCSRAAHRAALWAERPVSEGIGTLDKPVSRDRTVLRHSEAATEQRRMVVLYMNAADVMLFTSVHEGAGLVVKEAMACDLPIVSVDVGDVAEVITGADNCYVTSRSPQEMADKIIGVLKTGQRSNGHGRIQRYEINNIATRIVNEVYNKVSAE